VGVCTLTAVSKVVLVKVYIPFREQVYGSAFLSLTKLAVNATGVTFQHIAALSPFLPQYTLHPQPSTLHPQPKP